MYLDPGFGSMVVQAVVGLIAVAGSSFFLFRQKIKSFFSRTAKAEEEQKEITPDAPDGN